jgi:transcriptional regulator with XRE-family HTH domain
VITKPKIAHPLVQELRRRRRAAGLSLDDVAAAAGVSKTIISEWENGHHEPTLSRLVAYARAVGAAVAIGDKEIDIRDEDPALVMDSIEASADA